ncbi:hypothetical protein CH352_00825 [Leptospira hartskeerlii]|uniref:DUF3800 domain-containing protein n=1 Tax=Leptospira hartskeerlii TaxID=2023177 RepID=A0A2M9X8C3_9LEPT|nr:hypothetical protein [Leptospira hartskeerlii]PJZ23948.1 hypothetical protein CH357_18405 [Leptospira hartskeerlii]PJZ35212.1 hypothetical protein CH352_00825 [Leptospira hartskeerlii]
MPLVAFIDESFERIKSKGIGIKLLCATIIDSNYVNDYSSLITGNIQDILHNPYLKRLNIKSLKSKGFHFCNDHREIKNIYIEIIEQLNFDCFITFAYGEFILEKDKQYEILFYYLMKIILYKYNIEDVIIESGGDIDEKIATEIIRKITQPKSFQVKNKHLTNIKMDTKLNPLLSVSDYMLGILRELITYGANNNVQCRDYLRIINKLRWVYDLTNKEFYDRSNLFPIDFGIINGIQ